MRHQAVYNLQVETADVTGRPLRVGLLHERTGVPLFALFLRECSEPRLSRLHGPADLETEIARHASAEDKRALQLLTGFFEAGGQTAHVAHLPFPPKSADVVTGMIGRDGGPRRRSGIFAMRGWTDRADLFCLPQASELDDNTHAALFSRVLEQTTHWQHGLWLVDFPRQMSLSSATQWARSARSQDAAAFFPWLGSDSGLVPPAPVAAAALQTTDRSHGIHDSAANRALGSRLKPIVRLGPVELRDTMAAGLNAMVTLSDGSLRLWGDSTLAGPESGVDRSIAARRTLLALREAVQTLCEPFVLEPMTEELPQVLDVSLHSFFQKVRHLFDPDSRAPFETDIRLERRYGQDVVEVGLGFALRQSLAQVSLELSLMG